MNKKRVTIIGVAVLLIAVYFVIKIYASNHAEKIVDKSIAKIANFVDVDYKKVSVDLLGLNVHISDILVFTADAKEKIKIDEIIINDVDDKSNIPTFLSISINGIELNINELGEDAEEIRELGYSGKLLFNLSADYNYDQEKKELNVNRIGIGADKVGEINISMHLGNINLDPKQIIKILFTYPQIMLYEAKINYEDASLVQRLMKLEAQKNNKSVKDFKRSLIQNLKKEIEEEKDKFTKKALVEIKEFIDDPEEFSISVFPAKPKPLGRIMRCNDGKEAIKLLNVKIKS